MPTTFRTLCTLMALLAMAVTAAAQPASKHPEVVKGVKQVEDGEYDAAILTLDAAVRTLSKTGGHSNDLARAYLYLGVAYLGKGHETSAKARFRDALAQVQDLSLSAEKFAPKVIEAFEKAKDESQPKKGGGSTTPILIGGGVLVAGGAAALALGGGDGEPIPINDVPAGGTQTSSGTVGGTGKEQSFLVVTATKSGTLEAVVTWQSGATQLSIGCQEQDPPYTPCDGQLTRPGGTSAKFTARVQAKQYLLSVSNYQSGPEPFTLTVKLP